MRFDQPAVKFAVQLSSGYDYDATAIRPSRDCHASNGSRKEEEEEDFA